MVIYYGDTCDVMFLPEIVMVIILLSKLIENVVRYGVISWVKMFPLLIEQTGNGTVKCFMV